MTAPHRPASNDDSVTPRMLPREHGAWGQIGLPLATGLAMGHATWGATGFALAAALAFVAHEPLLVALGHRGTRARTRLGALAWRRFAMRGGAALAVGVGACALVGRPALYAVAAALAMVALSAPFVMTKQERTTAGEVVLASTLAAAALPVAIGGGASWRAALVAWALWTLHGLLATLSVRGVIARHRKGATARLAGVGAAAGVAALCAAAGVGATHPWLLLAMAPCAALAVGLALRPVSPTKLRRVGWALVASSVLASVGILLGAG